MRSSVLPGSGRRLHEKRLRGHRAPASGARCRARGDRRGQSSSTPIVRRPAASMRHSGCSPHVRQGAPLSRGVTVATPSRSSVARLVSSTCHRCSTAGPRVRLSQLGHRLQVRPGRRIGGESHRLDLACLQLRVRRRAQHDCRGRRLHRERVQAELRRVRPLREPGRRCVDRARLVVDDGAATVVQRVDAVELQRQRQSRNGQRQRPLDLRDGETAAAAVRTSRSNARRCPRCAPSRPPPAPAAAAASARA